MSVRMIVSAAAAVFLIGGLGAGASVAQPGPNGSNNYGLCKAYFSGSERGQEQKRKAPPFQGLEAAADAADQTVEEWCAENAPHPGQGNGNGNG